MLDTSSLFGSRLAEAASLHLNEFMDSSDGFGVPTLTVTPQAKRDGEFTGQVVTRAAYSRHRRC